MTPSYLLVAMLATLTSVNTENFTDADTCQLEPEQPGPWGSLLEEWALSAPGDGTRQGRIMALPPSKGYYVTDRVGLAPPPSPPGPRPYDEWQMGPPPSPGPGKIVNRPPNPYKDKFKPSYEYSPHQAPPHKPAQQPQRPPAPPRLPAADRVDAATGAPQRKEVSETDLYLLGAIEKLVYRVDLMEKRLRKMEESVHYLVAGKENLPEPCAANFSRVGSSCYHFSSEAYDWKTANLACRKLRSSLLELDSETERRQLAAALHTETRLQEMDWWTGGLNPGLLWIWSHSARPVLGNTTPGASNTTQGAGNTTQSVTIVGDGRCLALVWDPAARGHSYRGQDCAFRHRYVCEKEEDKSQLSNEISRVSRALRLVGGRAGAGSGEGKRHAKIMWTDAE